MNIVVLAGGTSTERDISISTGINVAKSLKRDSEFGSIEEGKSASFLAIHSGSWNLKHSHNVISSIVHRVGPEDIDYFLADGTEVIRKGEFLFE